MVTVPGQLKLALAAKVATPLQLVVMLFGQVIVGAGGRTVTVNEQFADCPIESVTVQVTVVDPTGKNVPELTVTVEPPGPMGAVQTTCSGGAPPPTSGAPSVTCAPHCPVSALTVISSPA